MSAQDAAFAILALAVGACTIAVEIMDRSAAPSGGYRFGVLTLWLVVAILAAAAFL
jgi:hypothetical protein